MNVSAKQRVPKPKWLKKRLPKGPEFESLRSLIAREHLHTVCREAKCPNIWECFSQGTAVFLIMGPKCTRNCRFCAVETGPGGCPDREEADRIADTARRMGLDYVVITSVTRDDLSDGGASFFARTIEKVRAKIPNVKIEVLIPDFQGDPESIETVLSAKPDVLNHNIETVPRLYPLVRPEAKYQRSISLLKHAADSGSGIPVKSGMMLGLGETFDEIIAVLGDMRDAGCELLTLGQYLQPAVDRLPVSRYVPPDEFEMLKEKATELGFRKVASGPFVRSSYHARDLFL